MAAVRTRELTFKEKWCLVSWQSSKGRSSELCGAFHLHAALVSSNYESNSVFEALQKSTWVK